MLGALMHERQRLHEVQHFAHQHGQDLCIFFVVVIDGISDVSRGFPILLAVNISASTSSRRRKFFLSIACSRIR
jgi:hypothetical protein